MVWVKVCGITNYEDAFAVANLGVDAVGFIFASSPRRIEPEKVKKIIEKLPVKVEKIGVFVNEDLKEVEGIARYCKLTGIQLHGEESPEYCCSLSNEFKIIKVFRISDKIENCKINPYLVKGLDYVLLDTYIAQQRGGTGKTFDWKAAKEYDWKGIPFIIAGGITPYNVTKALQSSSPFGIDVNSGVEESPGLKDRKKLKALLEKVKGFSHE